MNLKSIQRLNFGLLLLCLVSCRPQPAADAFLSQVNDFATVIDGAVIDGAVVDAQVDAIAECDGGDTAFSLAIGEMVEIIDKGFCGKAETGGYYFKVRKSGQEGWVSQSRLARGMLPADVAKTPKRDVSVFALRYNREEGSFNCLARGYPAGTQEMAQVLFLRQSRLEPLALFERLEIDEISVPPQSKAFADEFLKKGKKYFVYDPEGNVKGEVTVTALDVPTCMGIGACVTPGPGLNLSSGKYLVSDRSDLGEPLGQPKDGALLTKMTSEFKKRKYPQSTSVEGEGTGESAEFLGALDLDGDGRMEILFQTNGYESYGFEAYKQQGEKWFPVASVDGGGC